MFCWKKTSNVWIGLQKMSLSILKTLKKTADRVSEKYY
jgi:hypothetical protein